VRASSAHEFAAQQRRHGRAAPRSRCSCCLVHLRAVRRACARAHPEQAPWPGAAVVRAAWRSLNMPWAVTLGLQELDRSWWYASAQPELQAEQVFDAQRRLSAARSAATTRRRRSLPRATAGAGCASRISHWRSSPPRHTLQSPPFAAHPAAGPSPSLEPAAGARAKQQAPGWGWRQLRGGLRTGRLYWVSNRAASPARAARSVSTACRGPEQNPTAAGSLRQSARRWVASTRQRVTACPAGARGAGRSRACRPGGLRRSTP